MKTLIFAALIAAASAMAATSEHRTTNGVVAVTNTASTAEWRPQAAFVLFAAPTNGTVTISRTSRGVTVPLARHAFTNAAAVTWIPSADYPIRPGDVLAVSSTVRTATLQLERNSAP